MCSVAPAYRPDHPIQLLLTGSIVVLNWTNSFFINGEITFFTLFQDGVLEYTGLDMGYSFSITTKNISEWYSFLLNLSIS